MGKQALIRVCCAMAVAATAPAQSVGEERKLFSDPVEGYSFSYPETWVIEPQRTNDFRVKVGDPSGLGSCMLKIIELPPPYAGLSADDMVKVTTKADLINGARQHGTEMDISVFKATRVGDRPAIYYEGSHSYQSLDLVVPLRTVNVLTKAGPRVYQLACVSTPADMVANQRRYRSVLQSLVIR